MNINTISPPFLLRTSLIIFRHIAEFNTRKERHNEVILRDVVKQAGPPVIRIFDGLEQVIGVGGLPEVVLNVIVLGGDAEFDELVFECSRLLEETMYFAVDFHFGMS